MNVLVTGGAGYIGSHAALRLLEDGHRVTVVDDLSRGHRGAMAAIAAFGDLTFIDANTGEVDRLTAALESVDLVLHFAALAYVGESVERPLAYYRQNVAGSLALLEAMDRAGVSRLVLSSTCATYGAPAPEQIPIDETCAQQPMSPYGRSKLMVEQLVQDYAQMKAARGESFEWSTLRYFNVAGADRRARIGEDHRPESHLIPICLEAALGQRSSVTIYGDDYSTPDGTCVRDYVHVEDLIGAHVLVAETLRPGIGRAYNVGLGHGHSVREVIDACRRVTGVAFDVEAGPRRPGDPPALFADPTRIRAELEWTPRLGDLETIIESAWQWKRDHPDGY